MRTPRPATVATTLIAVALVVLAATSATAVLAVARAQDTVTGARAVVTHYLDLQRGVSREAVAEANYRRAPTPTKRLRLENAIAAVHPALRAAGNLGDAEDAATVARLNDQYADGVRATLDGPPADPDSDTVGAGLEAVQDLLNTAIDGHRAELVTATQGQADVMHRLGFVLPTVFGLAFCVLGWTWSRMVQAHRRLRTQAEDKRERASSGTALVTSWCSGSPSASGPACGPVTSLPGSGATSSRSFSVKVTTLRRWRTGWSVRWPSRSCWGPRGHHRRQRGCGSRARGRPGPRFPPDQRGPGVVRAEAR